MSSTRSFLTIIAWPEGASRDQCAVMLAESGAGLDLHQMKLKAGQSLPAIMAVTTPVMAAIACDAINARGGDAIAPTMSDVESLGGTLKIRNLRPTASGLSYELWRGSAGALSPRDIEIIVRGQLSESKTMPAADASAGGILGALSSSTRYGYAGSPMRGYMFGGAYGMALSFYSDYSEGITRGERTTTTSQKIDIHAPDGRVLQIDGDKFGYEILGEARGFSDMSNMDAMCELLTAYAPDAVVDPYFQLWRPPAAATRIRVPQMLVNDDDPAYAFYSRWMAVVYRHLLR